jgi:cell division transport system permease protein
MRALRYAIEEAALSLWRGRQAGVLSTLTIALALFVLGGFLLVTANLDRLGSEWSRAAELSVYLKDEVTAVERRAIEAALAPSDLVAATEFVSKSDALVRFKQTFADLSPALDSVGGNPLPASFEVRLRPGPGAGSGVDILAAQLQQLPGVADVRYDRQWLDRLLSAIRVIRGVGLLLGSLLTIAAH